jgi:hypothetical protein
MGIQSFTPSGGGGTPGLDYIASIEMTSTARSWAQSGAAGNYFVSSGTVRGGYVYFRGSSVSTGGAVGTFIKVEHSFTSIDIVGFKGDIMALNKSAVKSTTINTTTNASMYTDWVNNAKTTRTYLTAPVSGTFTMPSFGLPLFDVMIVAAGGSTGGHGSGGGGGGGIGIFYNQMYNTPIVFTVGQPDMSAARTSRGGDTTWGAFTVLGGGNGSSHQTQTGVGGTGANGGGSGGGHHSPASYGSSSGTVTTLSGGTYHGGNAGGSSSGTTNSWAWAGGGGGGALGAGSSGGNSSSGNGGAPLNSDFSGAYYSYSGGGAGSSHSGNTHGSISGTHGNYGHGGGKPDASNGNGTFGIGGTGAVIVRYYT